MAQLVASMSVVVLSGVVKVVGSNLAIYSAKSDIKLKQNRTGNTTITDHSPTHGTARKRHRQTYDSNNTIKVKQPDLDSSLR